MKTLHEIIKEFREKKMISQKTMADRLHMTQSTYSRIETGKTQITLDTFISIARILGVPPTELLESYIGTEEEEHTEANNNDFGELLNHIFFKQSKAIETLEAQNEYLRQMFIDKFKA